MDRILRLGNESDTHYKEIKKQAKTLINDNFPNNALNKELSIMSKNGVICGRVTEISEDGEKFVLLDYKTGKYRTFKTELVIKNIQGIPS